MRLRVSSIDCARRARLLSNQIRHLPNPKSNIYRAHPPPAPQTWVEYRVGVSELVRYPTVFPKVGGSHTVCYLRYRGQNQLPLLPARVAKGRLSAMNWMSNAKIRVSRAAQGRGKQRGRGHSFRSDHAREGLASLGAENRGAADLQAFPFPQSECMASSTTAVNRGGASADVAMLATEIRTPAALGASADEAVVELVLYNDGHSVSEYGGHVAAAARNASPAGETRGKPLSPPTFFSDSSVYVVDVFAHEEKDKTPARSWLNDIFEGALHEGGDRGSSSGSSHQSLALEHVKRKLPPDWSDDG